MHIDINIYMIISYIMYDNTHTQFLSKIIFHDYIHMPFLSSIIHTHSHNLFSLLYTYTHTSFSSLHYYIHIHISFLFIITYKHTHLWNWRTRGIGVSNTGRTLRGRKGNDGEEVCGEEKLVRKRWWGTDRWIEREIKRDRCRDRGG